jgi:hypothetical protein
MAYLSSQNIWRAFVAQLRSNATLRAALTGGIHEGIAADAAPYPLLVWMPVVPGVKEDTWNSRIIVALGDAVVVSRSSVEANNLDQLVLETLDEASLGVIGQSSLICHRVADIRLTDSDEEGRRLYRAGGSYEIWTSQVEGVREHRFAADAVIA